MRAIDTNVLVRLMIRDDDAQVAAAEKFASGGAWVSLIVLAETFWVLRAAFNFRPAALADALDVLLEHETITLQDADLVRLALSRFRKNPAVGFADCLILESAQKAGCLPLGTFDRALGKLEGAVRIS